MDYIDGFGWIGITLLALMLVYRLLQRILFTPEDEFVPDGLLVCPACGSRNISGLKHNKNWLKRFGPIMGVYTCQDCDYDGLPLQVNTERDQQLLEDMKKDEDRV
ncbi:MAG: hypothetical protein GF416_06175 [Candidatus Altiarchaeales archaeon]|nr:hypothetical protein [Candidatus Altiarchaeales archaeon]MBD3416702.1 hypothetical protein [Candidatus Altiarchaeales archaeon]